MYREKQLKTLFAPIILLYLRTVAHLALSQTHATVIGIAGSVGKTSTREALYAILRDIAPTHMVAGNSETGVPLGLVGLFPHDYSLIDWIRMMITAPFGIGFLKNMRYIIVEMGIDDPYPPKNMEYLLTIVQPHIGIITDESAAHTMQFEKILPTGDVLSETERMKLLIEAITRQDAKMLNKCNTKIVNGDNPFLKKAVPDALTFYIAGYEVSAKETTFSFIVDKTKESFVFKGYVFPKDLGYSFAPAILAAHKLNIPMDVIKEKLEKNFVPPKGRESMFAGINNSIIIDSSYNASRPSVISFLKLLTKLKQQTKRHTIVVLADMLELGNESQIEHEAVARAIGTIPDTLYLVGPLTKRFILPIVETKIKTVEWFPTITDLNAKLRDIPKKSLLLFKGSQGDLWLEESIKSLLKNKGDISRLCRQTTFWKKVKIAAGRWVD